MAIFYCQVDDKNKVTGFSNPAYSQSGVEGWLPIEVPDNLDMTDKATLDTFHVLNGRLVPDDASNAIDTIKGRIDVTEAAMAEQVADTDISDLKQQLSDIQQSIAEMSLNNNGNEGK